ncbi:hypothetical protein Bbelb_067720 [Branchiostoma belcheri]|nr:hypothetical protein Bbelb_067720 [Branchiostoma belcheri]
MDRDNTSRPQRRTALVAKELERYSIDIAALSETRLPEEGSLTEPGCGYTFFWKGKAGHEDRIHGVGFAIKSSLLKQIPNVPSGINERLMKLRLPISNKRFLTIVSAYAPTLTSTEESKEQFYADLDTVLRTVPGNDKLLVLGDFNARVGKDYEQWKGVIGKHGLGKVNSSGLSLLSKCAEHNLAITNTMFRQDNKYKTTWMHPRSKQWHMIDYVITRQRDISDIHLTRVMRGADCWTDHRLVRTKCNIHIAPTHHKRPKQQRMTFNIAKLQSDEHLQEFQTKLDSKIAKLGTLDGGPEEKWNRLKECITATAKSVLGPKTRHHQDWFDENDESIKVLLNEKRKAYTEWQNCPSTPRHDKYKMVKARVQKQLRDMQNEWWEQKAAEVQHYADSNNSKMLFAATKAIYGPQSGKTAPLMSADGQTVIKDKEGISARWEEHFTNLLNRPSPVDEAALQQVPQRTIQENLDIPPTEEEVKTAIRQMNNGKAQGKDGIPAELYKSMGETAFQAFHDLLLTIWETECMPSDLRDATIIALYKNKGQKSDCGNYRGISLLSIAGKILARILLNRLISNVSESNLPEAQCGFRPGRSTTDMVFALRQVQEKCIEQRKDLFAVFIDLTKAFDSINREALWTILTKLGCPKKFTTLVRLFHDNMTAQVLIGGDFSKPFNITTGVKQGCVLAPVLFNLFFTQVLLHAVKDLDLGVYIKYRSDGSVFDLRRLQARTKTVERLILEALFADDCALLAHMENHLQLITDRFAAASKLFGLTISLGKTEVLVQPAPNTILPAPSIKIDSVVLQNKEHFTYLGSTVSADGSLDKEISCRIRKASQALGRLRAKVLQQRGVKLSTKLKIYNAVVISTLLYGCETWTLYRRHIKQLEKFHMRSLRTIMNIRWQDKITNQEVLDRAQSSSIEALLLKAQLRWSGHVSRMDDSRIPRQLLYGELKLGSRRRGRPKLRYKDVLKNNLQWCGIKPSEFEAAAADRPAWRALVTKATSAFEEERRRRLEAVREKRHRTTTTTSTTEYQCSRCGKLCASAFGLRSHQRIHPT